MLEINLHIWDLDLSCWGGCPCLAGCKSRQQASREQAGKAPRCQHQSWPAPPQWAEPAGHPNVPQCSPKQGRVRQQSKPFPEPAHCRMSPRTVDQLSHFIHQAQCTLISAMSNYSRQVNPLVSLDTLESLVTDHLLQSFHRNQPCKFRAQSLLSQTFPAPKPHCLPILK